MASPQKNKYKPKGQQVRRLKAESKDPEKKTLETETPKKKTPEKKTLKTVPTGTATTGEKPRSKQQQHQEMTLSPIPVFYTRDPMAIAVDRTDPPGWPKVGIEEVTEQNLQAIRNTWNLARLKELRQELSTEYPQRPDLVRTVERQIVRCELYDFMGRSITTQANIYADGKLLTTTVPRDVKLVDTKDDPLEDGEQYTKRLMALWNTSLKDSEVETIRDIHKWANGINKEYLVGRRKIVIQIIGTSGPCDACKERLSRMANELLTNLGKKTGMTGDGLPPLEVWSYYGNPSKDFQRDLYFVRNGWSNDGTPKDLAFTNRANWPQYVREHQVLSTGGRRQDTDPSQFEVKYTHDFSSKDNSDTK